MSAKYLYGATVQGVQEYIFQYSKLKDICAADANVSNLREELFSDLLRKHNIKNDCYKIIENGAGKIKVLFDKEEDCKKVVRNYLKEISYYAPGIVVSQAVVEVAREKLTREDVVKLDNLIKTQRNKPTRPTTMALMGIKRDEKSGLPVLKTVDKNNVNSEYKELCKAFFPNGTLTSKEFSELTGDGNFIAVVHIDGNGLTKITSTIEPDKLHEFDDIMSDLMTGSAAKAYDTLADNGLIVKDEAVPIRPIALAGDDLTIVCRADLALPYTKAFIEKFEELSEEEIGKVSSLKKLTACAGIAFIKSTFPYYYGYQLAEELCKYAKRDARDISGVLPPSCIMFHKVQDSFVVDYQTIINKELTAGSKDFVYGPYYVASQSTKASVDDFLNNVSMLSSDEYSSVKNGLRKWVSLILRSDNSSKDIIDNLELASGKDQFISKCVALRELSYPTYDLLSYCSLIKK